MASNLMPSLNHAPEKLNVLLVPLGLTPIRMIVPVHMNRRSVGGQKECSWEAVLVENGDSSFELASQPVVESKRNKCWFIHCLTSSRAPKSQRQPTATGTART